MIRHLVALRFKPGTRQETKLALYADLAALKGRLEGIVDFQSRANSSPEDEMVRGYRDLFWFDFRHERDRDIYLEDPTHKAIGKRLVAELQGGPEGVFVIDFDL